LPNRQLAAGQWLAPLIGTLRFFETFTARSPMEQATQMTPIGFATSWTATGTQ
jgi:hypothetical protein